MSGYKNLHRNQRKAVQAFLDPENDSLRKVGSACNLSIPTLVKYCSDPDFMEVISAVKTVINFKTAKEAS